MKLWQKNNSAVSEAVERFTTGRDRDMDLYLARYDVLGSLAHLLVLEKAALVTDEDARCLREGLLHIHQMIGEGHFQLAPGMEDVHSQIEWMLTQQYGEAGKKIHTGRSRNDQVATALKLFFRSEVQKTVENVRQLAEQLQQKAAPLHGVLMPGYTHFQVAMPSAFGLWIEAYAEALGDDLLLLYAAWELANKSPLGSAAGYGSSFPLDRDLAASALGCSGPHVNVVTAQMSRGKTERVVAQALAGVAATLAKLAYDCCLFMSADYGLIRFPDHLTTGSSIMPHKKNPDVFELIRARCNALQALPNTIAMIAANLPSGYHRDMQLLKEYLFPAFEQLQDCMEMTGLMIEAMMVNAAAIEQPKYRYLFTVEEVNRLVVTGVPFRSAYQIVGQSVENGTFEPRIRAQHTHLGSIDQPGSDRIKADIDQIFQRFDFQKVDKAEAALIGQTMKVSA